MLLHYACDVGASRCMVYLVETCGADPHATDNRGCNAVMHAIPHSINHVQYLVSQGNSIANLLASVCIAIMHKEASILVKYVGCSFLMRGGGVVGPFQLPVVSMCLNLAQGEITAQLDLSRQ